MTSLLRGLAAGAAGTTVLNAVTYLDMALTGRPSSQAPARAVEALAERAGVDLPTSGAREEAYGALGGLGVGAGIGAVAGLVRRAGVRLPLLAEAAVIGLGAMAATDGPMAAMRVTSPSEWSATDWTRDVVPHLAYGATVAAVLRAVEPEPEPVPVAGAVVRASVPHRPSRVLRRSLALGLASGGRSSLGLLPAVVGRGSTPKVVTGGLVAGELVVDKLPMTPSRIGGPMVGRVLTAATGAAVLARREEAGVVPAAAVAVVGAVAGSVAGVVWRDVCSQRSWAGPGALVEDGVSIALAAYALKD